MNQSQASGSREPGGYQHNLSPPVSPTYSQKSGFSATSRRSTRSRRTNVATDYFPKPPVSEVNIPFRNSPRSGFVQAAAPPPPHVGSIDDQREQIVVEKGAYKLAQLSRGDGIVPGFKIPNEEVALPYWRGIFKNIDLSEDGYIDKDELTHVLAQLGMVVPARDLEVMIALTNPKTPNRVGLDDFLQFWKAPHTRLAKVRMKDLKDEEAKPVDDMDTLELKDREDEEARLALENDPLGVHERADKKAIMDDSGLKPSDVRKYFARFNQVDKDGSGELDYQEFCDVLGMDDCEDVQRAFMSFDTDRSGTIHIKEFIMGLQLMTDQNPRQKLKFAFQIYDEDDSKEIEFDELQKMVEMSLRSQGVQPSKSAVTKRCQQVYNQLKLPYKAIISYDQFMTLSTKAAELIAPAMKIQDSFLMNVIKKG